MRDNRQARQRFAVLCMAMILAMAALSAFSVFAHAANGQWGMKFTEDGKPPAIDVPAEFLTKYDAVYLGDTSQKKMYLTFDAGYENGFTPAILDTLKRHGVPAAFFVVGHYMETNPDLVRRMADEGHMVGNHSFHHPDITKFSDIVEFKRELESLETLYKEITGAELPRFFRPPQGQFSEKSLRMTKELGYKTVFWSLAYKDWERDSQPSREQAFSKLIPRAHNGAIILLHSTSQTNAEILDELLTKWKDEGYAFGTLDEA